MKNAKEDEGGSLTWVSLTTAVLRFFTGIKSSSWASTFAFFNFTMHASEFTLTVKAECAYIFSIVLILPYNPCRACCGSRSLLLFDMPFIQTANMGEDGAVWYKHSCLRWKDGNGGSWRSLLWRCLAQRQRIKSIVGVHARAFGDLLVLLPGRLFSKLAKVPFSFSFPSSFCWATRVAFLSCTILRKGGSPCRTTRGKQNLNKLLPLENINGQNFIWMQKKRIEWNTLSTDIETPQTALAAFP